MKKSTWIALLLLAALAGVFFVIRDEPKSTIHAPMIIEPVKDLSRVEIVPPDSAEGAELLVFERRDGTWKMTRPVDSELSPASKDRLGGLFSREIRTDDLALSIEKSQEYGLDEASTVKLSAYSHGLDSAAVELEIGNTIMVTQSGAMRTYVRKAGEDNIYRAQISLGDFVRQSADDFRSKSMVGLDPQAITDVSIADANRAKTQITRNGDAWELVAPVLGAEAMNELDQTEVKRLVYTLARVRAVGFANDKKPAEVGLEPAEVTVSIDTIDGKTHVLAIGDEVDGGKFYARFDDGVVFTVAKSVAERLSAKPEALVKKEKSEKAVEKHNPHQRPQ